MDYLIQQFQAIHWMPLILATIWLLGINPFLKIYLAAMEQAIVEIREEQGWEVNETTQKVTALGLAIFWPISLIWMIFMAMFRK